MPGRIDPLSGAATAAPRPRARCGDGCLDKLALSVRRARNAPISVVSGGLSSVLSISSQSIGSGLSGGSSSTTSVGVGSNSSSNGIRTGGASSSMRGGGIPAWPASSGKGATLPALGRHGKPLLLLGMLSGSLPRREMLRCSWMRVNALARDGVRVLFIVGKENAENRSDVLAVNVKEGAFMRSKNDKVNQTRSFDVKKLIRTGSVTTYWKLVEWLKYAATQPEPMVGRADDDVFISPRMLIAHTRLLLGHAMRPGASGRVYAGVFEWYVYARALSCACASCRLAQPSSGNSSLRAHAQVFVADADAHVDWLRAFRWRIANAAQEGMAQLFRHWRSHCRRRPLHRAGRLRKGPADAHEPCRSRRRRRRRALQTRRSTGARSLRR
jgi:hypothetical protein